jgi:hypothetical protein
LSKLLSALDDFIEHCLRGCLTGPVVRVENVPDGSDILRRNTAALFVVAVL